MKTAFLALYALCAAVPMYASQQMPLSLGSDTMLSSEQESLMHNMDVVELMRLTGHYEPWLEEQRLVQVFDEDAPRMMTEGDKLRLKRQGRAFMDITDHQALGQLNKQRGIQKYNSPLALSSTRNVTSDVKAILSNLDDTHLRQDIQDLTAFYTRNYRSDWGRKSSDWVYTHVEAILSKATKVKTSVAKFPHRFPQSSVIARIEDPEDDTPDKPVVIVGAHQDSLNYMLPFYRAPGADDDGSGTVTIFQVLRSLVEHNFVPPKGLAVEFMWFAAEEGGLLGSQDIASSYEQSGRKVKGMLQLDMVAFVKQGTTPIIAFFKDVVDAELTAFGTELAERYIPLPWNMTGCGSSCGSDHMSFTKAGYPAMFATEGLFENGPRTIHTHKDDLNTEEYSFEHMLQFVKFGIAFAVELAVA